MTNKINSIQYLRAIAALLVVFSHVFIMRDAMGITRDLSYVNFQAIGAIGVDVFFVISGFIITYTATNWKGKSAAGDFAKRRFIRVAPAYYIASGLFLLRLVLTQVFQNLPPAHRLIDSPTLIKTLTILPLFDKGGFQDPVLPIGWTLSFEFLFYLIFTLLILVKVNRRDFTLLCLIVLLAIAGAIFPIHQVQLKFITNPIIMEFAFGVFICILYRRVKKVSIGISIGLLASAFLMFLALLRFGFGEVGSIGAIVDGDLASWRVVIWGVPSALFVAGAVMLEKCKPHLIREHRFLLFTGEASYSLYLIHQYAFMFLVRVAGRFPYLRNMNIILFIIVSMVSAYICGALFHVCIEKPLIRKLNKIFVKPKPLLPAK